MAIPKNIERFITLEQAKALVGDDVAQDSVIEAILEDTFAFMVNLCPSICAPDFTEISTIRAALRGAITRKVSNPTGAVGIAQSQGENSQSLTYTPTPSGAWILTRDEKQMVLDACARYTSGKNEEEERARIAGAEASRLGRYGYQFDGDPVAMVKVERIPQLGRRTTISLPRINNDDFRCYTPGSQY